MPERAHLRLVEPTPEEEIVPRSSRPEMLCDSSLCTVAKRVIEAAYRIETGMLTVGEFNRLGYTNNDQLDALANRARSCAAAIATGRCTVYRAVDQHTIELIRR